MNYPIALEGALKLKEISYIHAEGYPAGEMKHGPIALIDEEMPVVAIAPFDGVFEKMLSNIEEVKARSGIVIAVTDEKGGDVAQKADFVLTVPKTHELLSPAADGPCRSSSSRTTSRCCAAATSISPATSRRASPSSRERGHSPFRPKRYPGSFAEKGSVPVSRR